MNQEQLSEAKRKIYQDIFQSKNVSPEVKASIEMEIIERAQRKNGSSK